MIKINLSFFTDPLDANYIIFASLVISVPALIFLTNEENRRLELDTHSRAEDSSPNKTYGSVDPNHKAHA